MGKIDEILDILKSNTGFYKKEEKKCCKWHWVVAGIVAVAALAAVAYALYRYFSPEDLEDLEEDFDDDFDDDFFEDEEEPEQIVIPKQEEVVEPEPTVTE